MSDLVTTKPASLRLTEGRKCMAVHGPPPRRGLLASIAETLRHDCSRPNFTIYRAFLPSARRRRADPARQEGTWLKQRGREPGPLFINFHHANEGLGRLHANGIYWIIRSLGGQVEVTARPHGFRHSSITTGLDRVKDPRKVQKHGRHASMDTTMIYDDALSDFAGEVAKIVSQALEE